jgi:predicted RNase H-like nuclease
VNVDGDSSEFYDLLSRAQNIVVDAPIGLPVCPDCGQLRDCDRGAQVRVGNALKNSVFPVATNKELEDWRAGRADRRGGHIRGLLPAISSAESLQARGLALLESHPELVFAILNGEPLTRDLKKTTLCGVLRRAELLHRHGVDLANAAYTSDDPIAAQDVLDAGAMALVALHWWRHGDALPVIRSEKGESGPLGRGARAPLMALPVL